MGKQPNEAQKRLTLCLAQINAALMMLERMEETPTHVSELFESMRDALDEAHLILAELRASPAVSDDAGGKGAAGQGD